MADPEGSTETAIRLLIVGKAKSGKSTAANTILGTEKFTVGVGNQQKTRECLLESEERCGRTIEILECHGEFDTKNKHEDVPVDIAGALVGTHPGPHAILYVVSTVERYADRELKLFLRLKRYLGSDVTKHMIVLLTHGDLLHVPIEQFIRCAPQRFRQVLTECSYRYEVFGNRMTNNDSKIKTLLEKVDSLRSTNDDQYYQSELSRRIGQALEEEIKSREKHFEETESQAAKHMQETLKQMAPEEAAKQSKGAQIQPKESARKDSTTRLVGNAVRETKQTGGLKEIAFSTKRGMLHREHEIMQQIGHIVAQYHSFGSDEFSKWAKRENLSTKIRQSLTELGLDSLEKLSELPPDRLKEKLLEHDLLAEFESQHLIKSVRRLSLRPAKEGDLAPSQQVMHTSKDRTTSPKDKSVRSDGPALLGPPPAAASKMRGENVQNRAARESLTQTPVGLKHQRDCVDTSRLETRTSTDHGAKAFPLEHAAGTPEQCQTSRNAPQRIIAKDTTTAKQDARSPDFYKVDLPQGGMKHKAGGKQPELFRFLLLGKSGSGKSSTGNSILGEKKFDCGASLSSMTDECETQSLKHKNMTIEVMDCPGLYDTKKDPHEVATMIVQAVAFMHPGPHAILFVVSAVNRYTDEEHGVFDRVKAIFDEKITKHIIVVFTHGDDLEREKKSLDDLLQKAPPRLVGVLRECEYRRVLFNNNAKNKKPQVKLLLEATRQLVKDNAGVYVCPKYKSIGEKLEKEVQRRLEESKERDQEREEELKELKEKLRDAESDLQRHKMEIEKRENWRHQQRKEINKRKQLEQEFLNSQVKMLHLKDQAAELKAKLEEQEHMDQLQDEGDLEKLRAAEAKVAKYKNLERERKEEEERKYQEGLELMRYSVARKKPSSAKFLTRATEELLRILGKK